MKDPNQQSDPIEEFFRKKAADYGEISYREEDWLKLDKQIELRQLQARNRKRIAWTAVAALLILSFLGFFTYRNHLHINELTDLLSQQTPPGRIADPSEGLLTPAPDGPAADTQENRPSTGIPELAEENGSGSIQAGGEQTASSITSSAEGSNNVPATRVEDPLSGAVALVNLPLRSDKNPDGINREPLAATGLACPECATYRPEYTESRVASVPIFSGTDQILASSEATPPIQTGEQPRLSGTFSADGRFLPNRESGLALGIIASPDLSTAGSVSNFTNPGYKIGLAVEYRLNRHLTVSTGLIHSTVHYNAYGADYNPPQGYLYPEASPDRTTAECILLDLPLTVKVDLIQSEQSRFFASAGLSTYIMLNEEYRFRYQDGQTGPSSWEDQTGTRHWMSNAGFSIGYEYDLMPDWSIRVEPFIKLPISEVGWGQVKLYSMGSFVSLNYRLR